MSSAPFCWGTAWAGRNTHIPASVSRQGESIGPGGRFRPAAPKDDADRAAQKARMDSFVSSLREPNYKDTTNKMIQGILGQDDAGPTRGDPLEDGRDPAASGSLGNRRHVSVGGAQAGETYSLPVMAIMMATPDRAGYEAQLRAVFP